MLLIIASYSKISNNDSRSFFAGRKGESSLSSVCIRQTRGWDGLNGAGYDRMADMKSGTLAAACHNAHQNSTEPGGIGAQRVSDNGKQYAHRGKGRMKG